MLEKTSRFAPPILLVSVAILVAVMKFSALGSWAYVLLSAAFIVAATLVVAEQRRATDDDSEAGKLELIRSQLQEQQAQLEEREQSLATRLAVYHEWMEFPQPIDLAALPSEEEISELAGKDRELHALLATASEEFFNNIRDNKYAPEGKFSLPLLRDDARDLAEKVARIYQSESDSEQPLLNTNIDSILRGASRVCLQMLTLMDQLPLDVKKHSIENVYAQIRRAVAAYGVYRKAEPYFVYVNSVYFLGRLALGANPISMGAMWIAGQVGKQATRQLTAKYANRQSLSLLHQAIRILGYEVANLYGAGFRYRDANWIYAAELSELLLRLPVNHRCLSQALREIGSLSLRSEFDRVFLYRCIAQGAGARPEQYRAASVLTPSERQAVAHRLEQFANAFSGGASPTKMQQWREAVEERLNVRILLDSQPDQSTPAAQIEAARALMGFLVEIKQLEPPDAWQAADAANAFASLDTQQREELHELWLENPAYFFEMPDLAPDSPQGRAFFNVLAELAVRHPPRGPEVSQVLENVAAFLRISEGKAQETLVETCRSGIQRKLALSARLDHSTALTLYDFLEDIDSPSFLFGGVLAKWDETPRELGELFLLGQENRLRIVAVGENGAEVAWQASKGEVSLEKGRYLSGSYAIKGGEWLLDTRRPEQLLIRSTRFSLRPNDHFRNLLDWIE